MSLANLRASVHCGRLKVVVVAVVRSPAAWVGLTRTGWTLWLALAWHIKEVHMSNMLLQVSYCSQMIRAMLHGSELLEAV